MGRLLFCTWAYVDLFKRHLVNRTLNNITSAWVPLKRSLEQKPWVQIVNLGMQSQGMGVRGVGSAKGGKRKEKQGHIMELASPEGDCCLCLQRKLLNCIPEPSTRRWKGKQLATSPTPLLSMLALQIWISPHFWFTYAWVLSGFGRFPTPWHQGSSQEGSKW